MSDFVFGLNTSTIRPASLPEQIRVAAAAGYQAIELWAADVERYLESGGALRDVARALDDAGLRRPSIISLKGWCDEDEAARQQALESARRRLQLAADLGVEQFVAGPPREHVPPAAVADRYAELLDLSLDFGVPAALEFLGFVESVDTLETAWMICELAGHPQASVVVDPWHMFRGQSETSALALVPAERIAIVHWNDAPREPARDQQTDAHRVMPGDGIIDLATIAGLLRRQGYRGVLSLELFKEDYWRQDALAVARLGLEKMRRSVG